jgi:hypothetical protein
MNVHKAKPEIYKRNLKNSEAKIINNRAEILIKAKVVCEIDMTMKAAPAVVIREIFSSASS